MTLEVFRVTVGAVRTVADMYAAYRLYQNERRCIDYIANMTGFYRSIEKMFDIDITIDDMKTYPDMTVNDLATLVLAKNGKRNV
ncbi:MAG: hypothetical protein GY757_08810 [bacterium]|nr:hypothetical protein [bacterium]